MQDTFNITGLQKKQKQANVQVNIGLAAVVLTASLFGKAVWDDVDSNTNYLNLKHNAAGKCIGDQFSLMSGYGDSLEKHLESKNIVIDMGRSGDWLKSCMSYKEDQIKEKRDEAESWLNFTTMPFVISLFFAASGLINLRDRDKELNDGIGNLREAVKRLGANPAGPSRL